MTYMQNNQVTPEQLEAFNRDGFLIVDNFFEAQELKDFALASGLLICSYLHRNGLTAYGAEFEEGLTKLESIGHENIAELYDACAQMPDFLRLVSKQRTQDVANKLLGRVGWCPLYCFTNRCRIDPPNDDRRLYGWHQEVFYTIPHGRFIQTWAPLIQDSSVENGTIEVAVGSHKEGIAAQSWTTIEGRATQIIVNQSVVDKYEQRVVPMKRGQMMFFDGRLFHRSGNNTSDRTRFTLVGMYHDVDAEGFKAPDVSFKWRGKSPRDYYEECLNGSR